MMTREQQRKDNLCAIKFMMMGRTYLYLSEPVETEDETIIALSWVCGEVYYTDSNGCQVGVPILMDEELENLRKELYTTIK